MKKYRKLLLTSFAVYIVLLILLVAAEGGRPDASIQSFWDAIWFSIITLTTVGYGDLSPVTPFGRVVGLIFAFCSVGILASLIGIGLNLLSGTIIPRFRLRFARRQLWYAFSEENEDTAALAEALARQDRNCLLIFPRDNAILSGPNIVRMVFDPDSLARIRRSKDGLSLFFVGAEPWDNYTQALDAAEKGIRSFCMADIRAEKLPPLMHLFSPMEVMSRSYWKEHPLKPGEKRVVLIGCGAAGSALLERALLTNVFARGRATEYHVFGDTAGFAALHPELVSVLSDGPADSDRLTFHSESWTEAPALLEKADRILLCMDEDEENLRACELLGNWFVVPGKVHVRLSRTLPGFCSFGSRSDCYAPEFVIKDELNRRAVIMNDIYNEGSPNPVAWRDLSYFLQQSNIAAADHLIVKARFLLGDDTLTELSAELCQAAYQRFRELYPDHTDLFQELEHRRWLRFHQMYNWKYDPQRDNAMRRHPMILPYEDLSESEQRKDAYAWEMLGRLSAAE